MSCHQVSSTFTSNPNLANDSSLLRKQLDLSSGHSCALMGTFLFCCYSLIPFGIGRRSCVGEAFAKSRMFLFITTLLQRFNFTRDPTKPSLSCDPRTYKTGIVLSPHEYCMKVTPRGQMPLNIMKNSVVTFNYSPND